MSTTELSDSQRTDTIVSLFDDDATLINAEEWLLQADYAAKSLEGEQQARAEVRRNRIKDVLIRLLPDVSDLRFAASMTDQAGPTVKVQAQTPYGWVPIRDMSLGYRTLIAWMVDFASRLFARYPNSPDPLAEPAIALVDEIDLHLHPRWQRTLMQFLTDLFPNTQFIVSAHSPLVVQAACDANIVLLRREGDHVVIDNDVKAIEGWRVDQVLTSDLFGLESARPPQLDGPLKERTQILSKARLTAKDKARLQELEAAIGSLPTGETREDREAMDIIRRAADLLKQQK
jgi:predicted ATP-binding protein involved in virulence